MARKQYRWRGLVTGQSQSGNLLFGLLNKAGSGKKLVVHSLEVHNLNRSLSTLDLAYRFGRATVLGGVPQPVTACDSQAALPSGITVVTDAAQTGLQPLGQRVLGGRTPGVAQIGAPQGPMNGLSHSYRDHAEAATEAITIRPGEGFALTYYRLAGTVDINASHGMLYVALKFVVGGRTFFSSGYAVAVSDDAVFWGLRNDSASDVVQIKSMHVHAIGSVDTPYLRVVPVGAADPQSLADARGKRDPMPLDTAYGPLSSSVAELVVDAPMLPFGVPQEYIVAGSTGSPKGFNYLHTKDFDGPQYAVMFPELLGCRVGVGSDDRLISRSNRDVNILNPRSPIVVRPGEGLGVVSSAETAVVASAVGTSGWTALEIGITFSVDNAVQPYLTLTGIQSGSDIVVLSPGTTTVIASVDALGGTTYSLAYDPDDFTTVDVCVYREGFVPLAFRNLNLGLSGLAVPVSQVVDRNFT